MKWIFIIIIIAVSTFIGKRKGDKYTKRRRLMSDLVLFCDYYVSQMKFRKLKVADILQGFTGGSEIAAKLSAIDLNTITPLEALNLLYELKKKL